MPPALRLTDDMDDLLTEWAPIFLPLIFIETSSTSTNPLLLFASANFTQDKLSGGSDFSVKHTKADPNSKKVAFAGERGQALEPEESEIIYKVVILWELYI